jgi:hypothetical protein
MSAHHFIVSQRESSWEFSHHGDVTGPFRSREHAIEEAIAAAAATGSTDVEVMVRDADHKTETVWKPDA